jgi:gamma-glutamyltranspeptidase/glutathione hydrolase
MLKAVQMKMTIIALLLCVFSFVSTVYAKAIPQDKDAAKKTLTATANAIATAHPMATQAGMNILKQGGNAFDAAVAVSATLAVVEPYSSGIGGGGFWLLHRVSDQKQVMIDGRERAPLSATETLYQDKQGHVIPGLSVDGPLAAGIPGEPAALVHIAKHYGRLPLKTSLAPAIRAAREGFEVDAYYQRMVKFRKKVLTKWPDSASVFLDHGGIPALGKRIKQPDLANTLQALADRGWDGFYKGVVAKQLVQAVRDAGGIWSEKDLAEYRVVEREPVKFEYRGKTIVSASPPSSGGIALATILNILSGYDLSNLDEASRTHLIVEAMRRAYRDRAEYLGDPDFVKIPSRLTDPIYAAGLRASIHKNSAMPSRLLPGKADPSSGFHTTHFSILDTQGNRVAATLSINYPFGSGFVAKGTGVLLNDEMDDFSAKPGVPNVYGLVGAKANAIQPGKRPLSSMSPTFVENDEGVAILGTPGGSRIITMVLLGILEAEKSRNPQDWVSLPRFHHQYLPDQIQYEKGAFDEVTIARLQGLGHTLKQVSRYGNMQALYWGYQRRQVKAASDPRGVGQALIK